MNRKISLLCSLVLCIAVACYLCSSCARWGGVRVISTNFEDEINENQNLVFTFSKDLVSIGELNTWYSSEYIQFSPKVEGKFKWTAPNELVFSPTVGFDPATKYTAELSKLLVSSAKEKYAISDEAIQFHTPFLSLKKIESFWSKPQNAAVQPVLSLHFNYPVNPQELTQLLKISDANEHPYAFQIVQSTLASVVFVRVQGVESSTESLHCHLEKGLTLPATNHQLSENLDQEIALHDANTLEVLTIDNGFEQNQGVIKVTFSQSLQAENIQKAYKILLDEASQQNQQTEEDEEIVVSPEVSYDSSGNIVAPIAKTPKPSSNYSTELSTKTEVQENTLIIHGAFNEADKYILNLNSALTSTLGINLAESVEKDIFFGDMPASIGFMNKRATYLTSKGHKNIAVNIVNVPKVNVKIAKIYENNILNFIRQNRYEDYNYDENAPSLLPKTFVYYEDESGMYSDVIVEKTVETSNLPEAQGVKALNLSLPDQNNLRGIYLVNIHSTDQYYLNATKLVSISDIGLITKQADDELWVFANSIKTTEALPEVEISLISSNNQTILTQKTNGNGIAVFKNFNKTGFKVALITAHNEQDFNYLYLEDTAVETSRFEVDGKRNNATGLDAFLYGDRDIYRPGETIQVHGIVRTQQWNNAEHIPVKLRLLQPNGKEYQAFRLETNEQGAIDLSIPTDRAAVTGTYVLELLNGNDVLLNTRNVAIEEFMPDRIKVDTQTDKPFYLNGERIQMNATAQNLFGPPASNRNYEVELRLGKKAFISKNYPQYVFDIQENTHFESVVRQGTTNDQGLASQTFMIPATYSNMGILEGKIYVTVFDETGRPVNRLKKLDIYTQPVFYGIGLNDSYVATNASMNIPLIALNKNEQLVNTQAQVEIIRFDYQTVIERNSDRSVKYSSKKQRKTVLNRLVTFNQGKANINYAPPISGEYEIRVHRVGSPSWTARSFYAYSWGNTTNSSFEVDTEGKIAIAFDKPKYQVGDEVQVLLKTPFAGKVLVTIERDKVLEYRYVETDKKSASFSFKVGAAHLPNVFVSATLIRPMDESNLPLTVAHGFAPVLVEDPDTQLPITITAVERSRAKTKQTIHVHAKPHTELTIAVVDEGILQLKNFKTPDPYAFFYQKRALETKSFDLYPFLLPEIALQTHSSIGGDGYDLEKRVNPLTNGRVNLMAIWAGKVSTDGSGDADFNFAIPEFSGDLRIMVIGYKDKAFGSATKNMKVADPLVISTALPRFASPNDELNMPVNITNTTNKGTWVQASVQTTGALQAAGSTQQKLFLAPAKEGRLYFTVKAGNKVGLGKVLVHVQGHQEKFSESIELSVRPSSSLQKTSSAGVITGNQVVQIPYLGSNFIPSSVKTSFTLSKSPMVQFLGKYQDLVGYPYGCIEQTVSKAFPQLYFKALHQLAQGTKPVLATGYNERNPNANVLEAIRAIQNRQLPSGAMAYWAGGDQESWWGSVFACHFLLEAQKANFEVNATTLGRLLEYIYSRSNKKETQSEVVTEPDLGSTTQQIASRENIYGLYVLALAGKPNRAVMNYYKSNPALLPLDEKYLLASAYAAIGDPKSQHSLLPTQYNLVHSARETGGSFHSPIRGLALTLHTLIETDPQNLQIPSLARLLSEQLKSQTWLSTQEEVFSFLALGKIAQNAAQTNMSAKLQSGKQQKVFNGTDLVVNDFRQAISVQAQGKGSLYYFSQAEGLLAQGNAPEEDHYLQVRRSYFDRNGRAMTGNTFKQNQLIVVKISLNSSVVAENIVVTDMLPAGFEIENPRLSAERDLSWAKDISVPKHFDIRDDRINFFTDCNGQSQAFYYLVRVVSKGKFTRGAVSADAMYNGELRSYNGAGQIIVE